MKYQVEKNTNTIDGIFQDSQNPETWDIDFAKYEIKQSLIVFEIGDVFEETLEKLVLSIRPERDKLLRSTDKYMLPDFPITQEQKTEIESYRKALRGLPETLTLENPEFPTKPSFI